MFRIFGDEFFEEIKENVNECFFYRDDEEGIQFRYYIDGLDVGFFDFNEFFKYVVQYLQKYLLQCLKFEIIKIVIIM